MSTNEPIDGAMLLARKKALARMYIAAGFRLLAVHKTFDPKTNKSGWKPFNDWRNGTDGSDWTPGSAGNIRRFKATTNPSLVEAWLDACPEGRLAVDGRESGLFLTRLRLRPTRHVDRAECGLEAVCGLRGIPEQFRGIRRDHETA